MHSFKISKAAVSAFIIGHNPKSDYNNGACLGRAIAVCYSNLLISKCNAHYTTSVYQRSIVHFDNVGFTLLAELPPIMEINSRIAYTGAFDG